MFKTTNQNQQPTLEAKIKLYLFFYIFFIYTLFILYINVENFMHANYS